MDGTVFDPGTAGLTGQKIVSLTLPMAAKSIKEGLYNDGSFKYFTALTEFNAAAVETVGDYAFTRCTTLTRVSLPAAQTIGIHAFYRCTALTAVTLSAAQTIGIEAFRGCTALETVNLPASLTTIGVHSFTGCTSLTAINVDSKNLVYKGQDGMLLNKAGTTLIAYPAAAGSVADALSGITTVDNYAFYECTALETVTLSAAQTIGDQVFYECTALETVSLPAATSIGNYVFANTRGKALTVALGATVPTLGTDMFLYSLAGTAKTVTVTVPSGGGWSGKTGTFSGNENTTGGPHWGEGFRGKGWNGSGYVSYILVNT
jgi:hypothetical protein